MLVWFWSGYFLGALSVVGLVLWLGNRRWK